MEGERTFSHQGFEEKLWQSPGSCEQSKAPLAGGAARAEARSLEVWGAECRVQGPTLPPARRPGGP